MAIYGTLPNGKRITIEEWEALTPYQQANMLRPRRKMSDQGKANISKGSKGHKKSNPATGRVPSADTRAKIGARHKGKVLSDETKAKISANSNKGKKVHDADSKARIGAASSERMKARWAAYRAGLVNAPPIAKNKGVSK